MICAWLGIMARVLALAAGLLAAVAVVVLVRHPLVRYATAEAIRQDVGQR